MTLHSRIPLLLTITTLMTTQAYAVSPQTEFFEKNIPPVLIAKCYECHSAKSGKKKGGLLLDSRDGLLKGGEVGPAVVPEKPGESILLQALRYDPELGIEMPPSGQLPEAQIKLFENWIEMGAPDPRKATGKADAHSDYMSVEEGRKFWAYKTPVMPKVPAPRNRNWSQQEIDRFILASLEDKGLKPVGDADRYRLLRRVTFDLTGLPPTPSEITSSHVDTFQYKPEVMKHARKWANLKNINEVSAQEQKGMKQIVGSPFEFKPRGKSGLMISELFPGLREHADDLCLLNGMYCTSPNHPPSQLALHTGVFNFSRPSMAAWLNYALGTENPSLPGALILGKVSPKFYGSAFLPAQYQGVGLVMKGDEAVPDIRRTTSVERQRIELDLLNRMNLKFLREKGGDSKVEAVRRSFETANVMQTSVPEIMDLSAESNATRELYGVGDPICDEFAKACLMAHGSKNQRIRSSLRAAQGRKLGSSQQPQGRTAEGLC